jgi:serine/threonine-protein kinase
MDARRLGDAEIGPGKRLRDYEITRLIGQGGMASVYEARHFQLGHSVAIKVMHPSLARSAAAAERFLREGRNAARIRHPHVVRVFDLGSYDGIPFLVMDLVRGSDLGAVLRREGPMHLEEVLDVMLPVISAVAAAHALGIVHRDIKPSNLALCRGVDGSVDPYLLDFGISKCTDAEDGDVDVTRSDALLGTLPYMAPEQASGGGSADERSDQYALGVVLYEIATGRRPYRGQTPQEVLGAILGATFVPPSAHRSDLPSEFDAIVARAMHRDPDERFPSVAALGAALLPLAGRRTREVWAITFPGADARTSYSSAPALSVWPRARDGRWSAAALVSLAVVAIAVATSVHAQPSPGQVAPELRADASVSATTRITAESQPATPAATQERGAPSDAASGIASTAPPAAGSRRIPVPPAVEAKRPAPHVEAPPPSSNPEPSSRPIRFGTNLAPILP